MLGTASYGGGAIVGLDILAAGTRGGVGAQFDGPSSVVPVRGGTDVFSELSRELLVIVSGAAAAED